MKSLLSFNRPKSFFSKIILPSNQIIMAFITFFIASLILFIKLNTFIISDPKPQIYAVTPNDMKEWAKGAAVVKVGLHISGFREFDMKNNKFGCSGILWFEFDPTTISLDTVSKFSFERGEIKQKSLPEAKIIGSKLLVRYVIDIEFSSDLNYQDFPLDNHRIYLSLINENVAPSEMIFESYYTHLMIDNKYISNWTVVNKNVQAGYSKLILDVKDEKKDVYIPKVLFSLDFQNSGARSAILIFLPLFILFLLSLFSLSLDPLGEHKQNIGSITLAGLTGMIAYIFIINQLSPVVGYPMLSDYIFMLILACTIVSNFLAIVVMERPKMSPNLIIIRGIVFLSSHIILLTFWFYFLYLW